jgi:hypothetical protein
LSPSEDSERTVHFVMSDLVLVTNWDDEQEYWE